MEVWLVQYPWIGMILWTLIYISDYALTIASARKYRGNPHVEFEGSFEMNPVFERDVNLLNPVSMRHLLLLVLSNLLLALFSFLFSAIRYRSGFSFILGMFVLMEVAVHFRHFRNLHLLTISKGPGGLEGKLSYRRWLIFSTSSFEFACFALLYLMTAILTYSLFFAGGAIGCLVIAIKHYNGYRTLYKKTSTDGEAST